MAQDRRYLEKHGHKWRVSIAVPAALQPIFGRKILKHPLGTDSLELANELKGVHVTRFKRMIRDAKAGRPIVPVDPDPLVTEALSLRADLQAEATAIRFGELDELGRNRPIMPDLIEALAERLQVAGEWRRAATFRAVATGEATPIMTMVDVYLDEQPFRPRQKKDYRRAVVKFVAWCQRKQLSATIEDADLKVAGRYVSEQFAAKGTPHKTANKDISALSSLWRWLAKKGHVAKAANPWPDQRFEKPKHYLTGEAEKFKRPFHDEEVATLLSGKASTLLHDAMWISALSGMRVEEVASLRVQHSRSGVMSVKRGKTLAAIRDVPIHSVIADIIARRSEGKADRDFIFHELPQREDDDEKERSQKIVKTFVTYRRRLKVDDRKAGHRQSRIDFHSFRRWFITKAERAGIYPHVIAAVVGHGKGREGMTLGVYSGGPDPETQMRQCVEAVSAPNGLGPRQTEDQPNAPVRPRIKKRKLFPRTDAPTAPRRLIAR